MRKMTLKEIRNMVALGIAEEITMRSTEEICEILHHSERVAYSTGVYGINGGVLRDRETGDFYALAGRSSSLRTAF